MDVYPPRGADLVQGGEEGQNSWDELRADTALNFLSIDSAPHTVQEAAAISLTPFIDGNTVAQKAGHLPKLPCGWSEDTMISQGCWL